MAWAKQFSNKLDELWKIRTSKIRSLVTPRRRGRPRAFTRALRTEYVNQLLEIATRILLKREGRIEFGQIVDGRKMRYIRGRGLDSRFRCIFDWARAHGFGSIIYSFWRGKKCLHVGRGESWRRLRRYDKSAYLTQATCLKIFCIHGRSNLPKGECLATHLFNPRDKRIKPAKAKWGKACPICKKHDHIRSELRSLFRMR